MRTPWWTLLRSSAAATSLLMLLHVWRQVAFHLEPAFVGGLPVATPSLSMEFASLVGSVSFYLPAGVLIGAVHAGSRAPAGRWHRRSVLLAALASGVFSFVIGGFVGPHLGYHATVAFLRDGGVGEAGMEEMVADDWLFFRTQMASGMARLRGSGESPQDEDELLDYVHMMSISSHVTVSFAFAAALLLPLGLALGGAGQRFRGPLRWLRLWSMAAALLAVIFRTHLFVWTELVGLRDVPAVPTLYFSSILIPGLVLVTLWWSGGAVGRRE